MAESVVSFVSKRIGDSLIQEASLLRGVRGQIEQMQTELKLMQSFLKDADKRQEEVEIVRDWVSEIREIAYEAEGVIDTYVLKIASGRSKIKNLFERYAYIIIEAFELHKVGSEINAVKTRISNLTRRLQTYGIVARKSEAEASSFAQGRSQLQWRQSYPHLVEEHTVGFDKDVKILMAQLVNEEKPSCEVVSICGMGGLGKTTLARNVYHHSDVRHHFNGFAWAYISQQCRRRDVWEQILFDLISPTKKEREEILKLKDKELAEKLYQVQLNKKCLVILDDIWTPIAWVSLRPAFPIGKKSSKILLTTRNKEVALHVDPKCFLYEPRCLTEEESWELLQKKAFPEKDELGFSINKDMEELGRKMVGRCAGLPLGIIVLGGLLATKHSFNEWKMMYENLDSHLRDGKGHEQHSRGVYGVLALSYHELPYRLKPCFLHLGHFPEDFNIPTKKLVRIWVAEGIVSCLQHELKGGETVETIAECYLNELVDRCVVQVGERSSSGRVKTCHLHDLMRDLCLLKANQENFLRIVDVRDGNKLVDSPSSTVTIAKSTAQIHRLALYGEETSNFFPEKDRTRTHYVRSLLFFKTTEGNDVYFQPMISLLRGFKLLRVLDLERHFNRDLPREIGKLIHLRYLSVNCSGMKKIPSSIGNLRCLQTLVLNGNFNKKNIPNVIWKMVQLRHLYFTDIFSRSGKLRLGDLRNLQTLQQFDIRNFNVEELTKLTNLRKLDIYMRTSLEELKEILKSSPPRVNLDRLRSLKIDWSKPSTMEETDLQRLFSACHNLCNLYLRDRIVKLPEYPQFPKNLTKLTLRWSRLEEDPMPTLEKLPYLTILHLYPSSFMGKEMVCSSKGFPQLKSLLLFELPNLEEWRVGEEKIRFVGEEEEEEWCVGKEAAMPNLSHLVIQDCSNLEEWRVGEEEIRYVGEEEEEEWCVGKEAAMPNLSHLVIQDCSNLKKIPNGLRFITSLRKLEIRVMPPRFTNRLQQGGEDYDKVRHVPSITYF